MRLTAVPPETVGHLANAWNGSPLHYLIRSGYRKTTSLASGKVKLRVVNASSDSTAYDAYANDGKVVSAITQATGSAYQELDSGTYILSFAPSGTTTQTTTLSGQTLDATHF